MRLMNTITHGTRYSYVRLKCRCEDCTTANRNYNKQWRDANRDECNAQQRAYLYEKNKHNVSVPKNLTKMVQADRLLKDGASYAETARTVGVGQDTVARWFPNRGWSQKGVIAYARLRGKFQRFV